MSAVDWYVQPAADALKTLGTSAEQGLSPSEAAVRLEIDGPNELTQEGGKPAWKILAEQFTNLLVIILIAAAGVSFALKDCKDGVAILVIVVLNGLLGFKQEYSAEKAMTALRKLSVPKIRVRRGGAVREIDASQLVIGDIFLLEAGNLVPADGRLIESASLRVQESALTGESEGIEKTTTPLERGNLPIGDRRNMVFMGTIVAYGRGEAVVTATGMHTELGHVATLLQTTEDEATPLARKLNRLGRLLVGVALVLIGIVAVIGLLRGLPVAVVFLMAVSMAVAAVPEGLPAVVTIALALGAKRMLRRKALIRKLPAVETLGSVTAICTDKTGTLTQNRMTVTAVELADARVALPPSPTDTVELPETSADGVKFCLSAAALCSDAVLKEPAAGTSDMETLGDPTEGALVVAAHRLGLSKTALEAVLPRIAEAPFDSDRKRMSTVHGLAGADGADATGLLPGLKSLAEAGQPREAVVFTKGAVDSLLDVSPCIYHDGRAIPMDGERREQILERSEALANDGIRVLGVACRLLGKAPSNPTAEDLEQDLVLLGFVGMMDPLRDEVKEAVATCLSAGIRPVMITGDHPLMARHIGEELGIVRGGRVLTGPELDTMSEAELEKAVAELSVYARVSPEHKLRIVDALQARGEIASMTGDGVNDAPALKSADIGVAMGITGTDVAKEASDMVLLDDMYSTIVAAVREGRAIFDNIRRFIRFILASNTGELAVMLVAPLFKMGLPLLPVQILWMNLVTDGLPALALGVEPAERDVMERPPRDPRAPIIGRRMGVQILWVGALMAVLSIWVALLAPDVGTGGVASGHGEHGNVAASVWQTMLFTTMVFTQLFLALGVRSRRDSLLRIGLFSNLPLLGALTLTFVSQIAVVYVPALQGFFKTAPLTAVQLGLCIAAGAAMLGAMEIEKLIARLRRAPV